MKHSRVALLTCVALSACALKGDVRRVEQQVQDLRNEMARSDSARADFLDRTLSEIIALQEQLLDSLNGRLVRFQGEVRTDMTEVQRQLVQIQELTGQSQARLSQLQDRIEQRESRAVVDPLGPQSRTPTPTPPPQAAPPSVGDSPDEIFRIGVEQLRRGSPVTARQAFSALLAQFPNHERAADAQFFLGESWEAQDPDSAAAAYEIVPQRYANSPRAPTALYRIGLILEQEGDLDRAKVYYERVVLGYPNSDAAELARAKLNIPGH